MSSPFSVKRFRFIFGITWLIIIADMVLLLKWFGLSWEHALIDSVITNTVLIAYCLLILNTLRFYTPRRERYIHLLVWCIVLTAAWLFISAWLVDLVIRDEQFEMFLSESMPVRGSIGFLLIGLMTMTGILWFNWEEQKEYLKRRRDAEKLSRDAELYNLRQQLQPHFLFNSLNSINALTGSKPAEARKMIQQLSDFLRGTLRKDNSQLVSLKEELQHLQLYLDIEMVRFGNRLSTVINVAEDSEQLKLPPLLLQPIVENAIKFGLYDTTGETTIHIDAKKEINHLNIEVRNPYDPETASPRQGTGFGLDSVQRRLYLLYARTDLLRTATKDNIFTTTVIVPQMSEPISNV